MTIQRTELIVYYWRYGYSPMTIAALINEPGEKHMSIEDVQKIGYAYDESHAKQGRV